MPEKEVVITVHWDLDERSRTFRLKPGEKWRWRITQRDGIPLMVIREEVGALRHEIPLGNVLYWTVDTSVDGDGDAVKSIFDRYCHTCNNVYYTSEEYATHPYPSHDIRRTCCGTSPQNDHHPACATRQINTSQQRIGQIVDIQQDDENGFSFLYKIDPYQFIHLRQPHNSESSLHRTKRTD